MRSIIHPGLARGVLVCLALAAAACGAGHRTVKTPVGSSTIVFGTHQPQSGPAAPGYSQIATASQAFFDYVNDHGGVYGRNVRLLIFNDAYNPTQAAGAVEHMVLYNNVFGIFEGLGTPTHLQVTPFLNAYQVPDVFVASPCPCWDNGTDNSFTYGWQPNSTIEGKILGSYIHRHFPGQRVGVLYQDDGAGQAGLAAIRDQVPQVVAAKTYQPGATTVESQLRDIKRAGAKVVVDLTLPAYTAMSVLSLLKLRYGPQLVVWSGGMDPITVARLLDTYSGGAVHGFGLIDGAITDAYLPSPGETSNPWIRLFRKIDTQYDKNAPLTTNVEYGMASAYTLVQALRAAGPNLTRQSLIDAINNEGSSWRGPGLVPLRYSASDHSGFTGARMGRIVDGHLVLFGPTYTTTTRAGSPITAYRKAQPAPPPNGFPGATP
ncbi:MAG TPA: ABC transporter substrate-binding protein [Solirubrobacteraceae bacterium]|jgi:ABC-type branched-subunit amino acid transport system substrate-binding protein